MAEVCKADDLVVVYLKQDTAPVHGRPQSVPLPAAKTSGNLEEAKYEEELWFHTDEIYEYQRADESIMFGE